MKKLATAVVALTALCATATTAGAWPDGYVPVPAPKPVVTSEDRAQKTHPMQLIKLHCLLEWPTDFRMQAYCVEQQIEAAQWLQSAQVANTAADGTISGPFEMSLGKCYGEWTSEGGITDWRMTAYCVKHQLAAAERLNSW